MPKNKLCLDQNNFKRKRKEIKRQLQGESNLSLKFMGLGGG